MRRWNPRRRNALGSPGVEIPAATRARAPRWRDARLWGGLACIVVAMFLGAALLSRDEGTISVWQASRDLAPGGAPVAVAVSVALGDAAGAYVPATEPLIGPVRAPVAAGALIPRTAIGAATTPGQPAVGPTRLVTVPVDALHAPLALAAGDVVDVWSTPEASHAAGAAQPVPRLVIERVLVVAAASDDLGAGGTMPVVLRVPAARTVEVVAASRTGVLDLVAVPIDDVVPGNGTTPAFTAQGR